MIIRSMTSGNAKDLFVRSEISKTV